MTIKNLYPSIKPSLDLDFARSKTLDPKVTFIRDSTATYYDGKTVVKAEENLLTWSQDFDNAAWVKSGLTVVANNAIAPDGSLTADYVTAGNIYQSKSLPSGTYTVSVWARSDVATTMIFTIYTGSVDVNSGTLNITTSWQQFTFTVTNAVYSVQIKPAGPVYLWGAQLEQRSSATAYTPTTSAPITNYLPALQYAAAHVPRFDHDPITGESKGLLIEEQRTNVVWPSKSLTNNGDGSSTNQQSVVIAPDGTLSANLIAPSSSSARSGYYAYNIFASGIAGTVTESAYIKPSQEILANGYIGYMTFSALGFFRCQFVNGAPTISLGASTTSANVTHVGNGWYRVATTFTDTGANSVHHAWIAGVTGGATNSSFALWGLQTEAGAFPTSYIPTTSAQVTRAADSASMTGTNFSSWYRADEGSLVLSYNTGPVAKDSRQVAISADGGTSNLIQFGISSSGVVFSEGYTNGSAQFGATQSAGVANTVMNAAIGYATNNTSVTYYGAAPVVDTSCIPPFGANRLDIGNRGGSSPTNSCIKRIAYYPKRLTDAQLQQLTQ